jgi:hypothetical protein
MASSLSTRLPTFAGEAGCPHFTEVNFIQLFCLLGSAWGSGKLRRCACRGGLEPVLQGLEGWMGEGREDARTLRVAQGAGLQVEPCGTQLPTVMSFG